jgi:hypothetical protein
MIKVVPPPQALTMKTSQQPDRNALADARQPNITESNEPG